MNIPSCSRPCITIKALEKFIGLFFSTAITYCSSKRDRQRKKKEEKEYGLRCEARTRQRLASLPRRAQRGAYIRARAWPLPRSCAHKRADSTQTLCVHELLAARALTQSRFSGCTHAHWPLSVHARIGLLIGACRGRLGSTNFGAPLHTRLLYPSAIWPELCCNNNLLILINWKMNMGKKSYNFILNEPRKNYRYRSISLIIWIWKFLFIIYNLWHFRY